MGDRAVVALEVVLDRHLPVARERPRLAAAEARRGRGRRRSSPAPRAARRASPPAAARRGRGATNSHGPHVATDAGSRPSSAGSRPGSRSPRGILRSAPSRSYVHAWYGHCSVEQRPAPASTGWPRWRHTLTSARSVAGAVAHDRERDRAGVRAHVAAGLGDLLGAAGVLPAAPEDQLALARVVRPGRRTSARAARGPRAGRRRPPPARARPRPPRSAAVVGEQDDPQVGAEDAALAPVLADLVDQREVLLVALVERRAGVGVELVLDAA